MTPRSLLVIVLCLVSATAAADERITDDTPYKNPTGSVRLGLWRAEYAVHGTERLTIGTYTLPYLAFVGGVTTGNGYVEYQLVHRDHFALEAGIGMTYVDFTNLGVDAQLVVVPIRLLSAFRVNDSFAIGLGAMSTGVSGAGAYNSKSDSQFRGAVAASTLQGWVSAMWRWSRGWTLYAEVRGISGVGVNAEGDATHMIDARTRVEVMARADANVDELRGASGTLALHYARKSFRLRAGAGYGNYSLPVLNLVVPVAIPYPELDLYFVF